MSTEKVRNTKRKVLDGIEFRSTLEANCYRLFRAWEAAGAIRRLVCQPKYQLQGKMRVEGRAVRAITYTPDFQFERRLPNTKAAFPRWEVVVIETKGYKMDVYRIKSKLFLARFPNVRFEEWTKETLRDNLR